MIWIYVAATIFGGAFLVPMILGGLDSDVGDGLGGDFDGDVGGGLDIDTEIEFDADLDLDVGDGIEFDAAEGISDIGESSGAGEAAGAGPVGFDAEVGGSPFGAIFASLLSFRTVVFFSAFFGTAGLVFGALGYSDPVTLGTAALIGAIAAVINSTLFGLIKNSQPNSQISDRTLEGRWAKVVLPMTESQRGRIRVDLSGQPQYIVARPIDGSNQQFDVGASVVVVKIENGTALVSSLAELDSGEEL